MAVQRGVCAGRFVVLAVPIESLFTKDHHTVPLLSTSVHPSIHQFMIAHSQPIALPASAVPTAGGSSSDVRKDRQGGERLQPREGIGRASDATTTQRHDDVRTRLRGQRHRPADRIQATGVAARPARDRPRDKLQENEDDPENGDRRHDVEPQ